jgi:hypothetical protein
MVTCALLRVRLSGVKYIKRKRKRIDYINILVAFLFNYFFKLLILTKKSNLIFFYPMHILVKKLNKIIEKK